MDVCITCKNEVTDEDKAMACDLCDKWEHEDCLKCNEWWWIVRGTGGVLFKGCIARVLTLSKKGHNNKLVSLKFYVNKKQDM